ncbi:hypothetical protein D9758_014482 [Tetrapyrgos nigripes]|uniref:pectinesterase n=1 Tax=Tetrapyrgos nigripes TaxID=182062 RepID=A0A8H5C6U7_9AGAR|nr:hypothetical protein D9758_014482 [Tetrapyrgos nigripes]
MLLQTKLLAVPFLLQAAFALSPRFLACQVQKPQGTSVLEGCPEGTIFVTQDATDPDRSFGSVQEAVESLPNEGEAIILIAEGEYHETVNVTRSGPLTLLGQLPASLANSVSSPFYPSDATANSTLPKNLVTIWNDIFTKPPLDDATSTVLSVAPNFNASLIGAGPTGAPLQPEFGNVDFKVYNIDWENRAANFAISQALVTDISYANASFYGCSFASFQDTWYTGRNGSTYVVDSVIYGQTDYLFGFGTAWFQNIILANRACGGGIVAWKGTNLTDAPDANASTTLDCFLGRPWNDLSTTVFLNTFMENIIQPAGWTPFGGDRPVIMNTTFYAEFNSTGPGGNTSKRIPLEHILTPEEARNFTIDKVFLEHPGWIDFEYIV